MDYEITEYLLKHKEGIHEHLVKLSNEAKNNPILKEYFKDAVVQEVINYLTTSMNLSYEEVAGVVEYDYLVDLLSEEFFKL